MKKVLILLLLVMASCSTTKNEAPLCPSLSVVSEGSFVTRYEEGTKNIYTQAVMRNLEGYCEVFEDTFEISGRFDLHAMLGEKPSVKTNVPFEYFIAVLDENNNVVIRKSYTENVSFRKKKTENKNSIEFNETLDLKSEEMLPKYNILLSFQLTEEELEDNRSYNNPY